VGTGSPDTAVVGIGRQEKVVGIGLAYLLARTTDTIADTELVPLEQRLEALKRLRERILTPPPCR